MRVSALHVCREMVVVQQSLKIVPATHKLQVGVAVLNENLWIFAVESTNGKELLPGSCT